jgi:molybdopterin molybdotransferase
MDNVLDMSQTLITVTRARELVLEATGRLDSERVEIASALNRIVTEDVRAAGDMPPFPCSAMDGFALRPGAAGRTLGVIGESRAGAPFGQHLDDGQAVRISTGAAVPSGATAVIRQEDVEGDGTEIQTMTEIAEGDNVRYRGEDMPSGTAVLRAGTVLGATELAAAVAAGAASLSVARRPRVTILCTGDELRAPGEPLGPGEIHNSNAPMLAALAIRCGAKVEDGGRLPDYRAETESGLAEALEHSDLIVVSGGVSVGPHDHVKPALASLRVEEVFWRVALQPGKPTWFGRREGRLVFGLPGNPVSAAVTFSLFVRPALCALQGAHRYETRPWRAQLGVAVRRNPNREQALRVRLEQRDLLTVAFPNGPQGSNMVTSLLGADALAMIPPGNGELEAGSSVALEQVPH